MYREEPINNFVYKKRKAMLYITSHNKKSLVIINLSVGKLCINITNCWIAVKNGLIVDLTGSYEQIEVDHFFPTKISENAFDSGVEYLSDRQLGQCRWVSLNIGNGKLHLAPTLDFFLLILEDT